MFNRYDIVENDVKLTMIVEIVEVLFVKKLKNFTFDVCTIHTYTHTHTYIYMTNKLSSLKDDDKTLTANGIARDAHAGLVRLANNVIICV